MSVVTGKENIDRIRLVTLRGALKLELLGMTRKGRSVYSIVKSELGFRGNKQKVYDQLNKLIESQV